MSELSPLTRALLDRARDGMSPDAAALARVRTKVGASVAGAGAGVAAKLIAVLVAASAVGGGAAAVIATHSPRETATAPSITLAAPAPAYELAPLSTAEVAPEAAPPAPPPPPPLAAPKPPTVAVAAHTPAPDAPLVLPRATLAREVELVDTAMAQLHRGSFALALATLATYDDETAGRGQLAEDAAALDIEARCRSHADDAAARLAAFDRSWPMSAQRPRLTEACK